MSYQEHFDCLSQMALDLNELKIDLESKFLSDHLVNQLASLDDFKFDVKSYCVLLHAAIEDFIEGIALKVYTASYDLFTEKGIITIPLMYALHLSGALEKRISDISEDDSISKNHDSMYPTHPAFYFFNCKESLDISIKNMLTANHGISRKYLKKIIMTLGIYIDFTNTAYSSWKSVAEHRGAYAHSDTSYIDISKAQKPLSPEKSKEIGDAAVDFAMKIAEWAEESLNVENKNIINRLVSEKEEKKKKELEKKQAEAESGEILKEAREAEAERIRVEKENNKNKNIDRTNKIDTLLEWTRINHSAIYDEIFGGNGS